MHVDVIVPCWGSYVDTLPRCLDSIPDHAHTIVVGDEASCAVAAERGATTVLVQPPLRVGAARELGRTRTRGEALSFLDSDDVLEPGALDRLARALDAAPDAVAVSASLRRSHDGTSWPPEGLARLACRRWGGPVLLFRNVLAAVGSCLVRASAVQGVRLFPDLDDEDWHAAVTLRSLGPVRFSRVTEVRYDTAPGSISRRARDLEAMRASEERLLAAAVGSSGGPALLWRLAEVLARPYRRRRRRRLARGWSDVAAR